VDIHLPLISFSSVALILLLPTLPVFLKVQLNPRRDICTIFDFHEDSDFEPDGEDKKSYNFDAPNPKKGP
jgi:hypothetical protein